MPEDKKSHKKKPRIDYDKKLKINTSLDDVLKVSVPKKNEKKKTS